MLKVFYLFNIEQIISILTYSELGKTTMVFSRILLANAADSVLTDVLLREQIKLEIGPLKFGGRVAI